MSLCRSIAILAVTLLFTGTSLAQQRPRKDGRGPEDPIRGALIDSMKTSPFREVLELLEHKPIQEEIGLSDAKLEDIAALGRTARDEVRDLWNAHREKAMTVEDFRRELGRIVDTNGQASFDIVKKECGEDKFRRLLGLYVQHKGLSAAANEEVAREIGLAGKELDNFREFREESWHQIMVQTRPDIEKLMRDGAGDRHEKMSRLMKKARSTLDSQLSMQLTSEEQRDALKALAGEPFEDLPKFGGRGPGPGPGPGRPGGYGGRRSEGKRNNGERERNENEKADPNCAPCEDENRD